MKISPIFKKVLFPSTDGTIYLNKKLSMLPFLFICEITWPHY